MPFIPVPNTVDVEVRFTLFNQQCENTLAFTRVEGEVTEDNLKQLCVAVKNYWISQFLPFQSYQVSFREVYGTDLTTATSPTFTENTGLPVGGGDLSDAAPGGTTLAYSFRTAARGRSGRGRNYWIGIPKAQLVGNAVNTTYANDILPGYQGMVGANVLSDGWTWVVISRFTNRAPRPSGLPRTITAASLVNYDVDSQRRRLAGRGE